MILVIIYKKRPGLLSLGLFSSYQIVYFRMASLAAFATRNLTTFFAGMLMVAPVAGLRPIRALRWTRTSLPKPGITNLSLAPSYAIFASSSRAIPACILVIPVASAIPAMISLFVFDLA